MNEPPQERRPIVILRRADQACAATVVAISLAVMAAYWVKDRGRQDDRIDLAPQPQAQIEFKLDVNTAEWTELALLPGVGEILAKRIVESRETEGPFLDHSDLGRVRGIGPRTLERVEPYLLPMPEMETVAGP
jgi:competence protein ComEA